MVNVICSFIKDIDVKVFIYMIFEKVLCIKIWYNVVI